MFATFPIGWFLDGEIDNDLKPANIILTDDGEAKLLDFGLAKLTDSALPQTRSSSGLAPLPAVAGTAPGLAASGPRAEVEDPSLSDTMPGMEVTKSSTAKESSTGRTTAPPAALTQTGMLLGTPLYMAPEAWEGQSASSYSDVYSLGAVLYELVAGQAPHFRTTLEDLCVAVMGTAAQPLLKVVPTVEPRFAAIVDRCLRRQPTERYASADALRAELESLKSMLLPPSTPGTRRPRLRWAALGVGAMLISGAGLYLAMGLSLAGMATIRGGRFMMGSSNVEVDAAYEWCQREAGSECSRELFEREQPLREVQISAFRIDRMEVTNQQFALWLNSVPNLRVTAMSEVFMGATLLANLYPTYQPSAPVVYDPSTQRFRSPAGFERLPVTQITWDAALKYCQDHGKRLPTEAEWEFAARGSTGRRFPWGHELPSCQGTILSRGNKLACTFLGTGPVAVGSAPQDRTPEGVHDLAGNVLEWVLDRFLPRYPECPQPCINPSTFSSQERGPVERVVRGGGWTLESASGRGAVRSRWRQDNTSTNIGFRCVAPLET